MTEEERCAVCPTRPYCGDHISLIKELAVVHTKQDIQIENQEKFFDKLSEIAVEIHAAKLIAVKDQVTTSSEIAGIKLKLKPIHWLVGSGGVAAISAVVQWIIRLIKE